MGDCMDYPDNPMEFIKGYSFKDKAGLVPMFRVEQMLEYYMQKWIPVSERLPEEKGEYLVTYHPCYWDNVNDKICTGLDTFRGKSKWAKKKYQKVIAWMPLPEPYSQQIKI